MKPTYDKTDPLSIDKFAEDLIGKTLREATGNTSMVFSGGRGDLGTLVEKLYFEIEPGNEHGADFTEAGLELKATGVKQLKNGTIVPKERLVLSMISYHEVVKEGFRDSYLLRKIRLMLILFYMYEKNVPVTDLRFLAKRLWELSEEDISLIILDWEKIVDKIRLGLAHELSEGDTLYLGACTKSADSTKRTTQPFSEIPAKPRAFSFKPSYMRVLLEEETTKKQLYENLLQGEQHKPLEDTVTELLQPFEGHLADQLLKDYLPGVSSSSKSRYALLTNRLLGIKSKKVSEFEKAGIIIRTVRLKKNGVPAESISFPYFDYMKIKDEEWDESAFKDTVESKFFFVVLQETDEGLVFRGGKFWNMPYEDRLEAQRVWGETVKRINEHHADKLPLTDFSPVAHVRPHGATGKDKIPAPGGLMLVKQCFWFNAKYIGEQLQ